jgi:hypothetical protein
MGSKMATVTQTWAAWAPWIRDLAEMLEPYLVEVKHQGELKLWHSEPLARGRLLHATIHWENKQATTPTPPPLDTSTCWPQAPNMLGGPSADQTGESQASHGIPQTPWDNQHNPPGQTDPHCKKKKKKLNKQWNWKLAHSGGGRGCWKHTGEGGKARSQTHMNHQ